jgi:PmbA protein
MDVIKSTFEKINTQAKKDGAKVELLVSGGENLSIGFQKNKMESFESTQTQMAGFRVILGSKQGYAYTENLSEGSMLRTYGEALLNARDVETFGDLEIPLVKPQKIQGIHGLLSSEEVTMDKKIQVARELEARCLEADGRVESVPYSGFDEAISFKRILNSEGLDQEFKQSYFSGYAYPLAREGEFSKMDGEGFVVRRFSDIDAVQVAKRGVEKAVSRLGAQKLKTGNYAVVIANDQFPVILQMLHGYFSAKEVYEGKSLLKEKLQTKIGSAKLTLIDDPFEARGTGIRPFDDEGAVSKKTTLIENGILKNFITNMEYASKMKLPHTAHARRSASSSQEISISNLVMEKGHQSVDHLLSIHPKTIYLTHFAGGLHAGFKAATGDFSMPAEGFLYENGKNLGPIDQFVMSGNVFELLNSIEELGQEYNRPGTSFICPDVLVQSLSFAGS